MLFPILNRFTIQKRQIPFLLETLKKDKIRPILDYTNENYKNHEKNYKEIINLIETFPNQYIAVKLSSLNIIQPIITEKYLKQITEKSIKQKSKLLIDAEQSILQCNINSLTNEFIKEYNQDKVHLYKTYQMYRKDSLKELEKDLSQPREYSIGVKLVRGAYYKEDISTGLLYLKKEDTDNNYNRGISLFQELSKEKDVLMCATHNEKSISIAKSINRKIEFSQLMGMSNTLTKNLAKENYNVFKYIPYGNFRDTYPYLIRRLYENYPMIINLWK